MWPIRSWVCRTVPAMVLVGSIATLAAVGDSSGFQSYTVKEAQITYALSGMSVGTKPLAFTDYGSRTRQATHATTTVMGRAARHESRSTSEHSAFGHERELSIQINER